MADWHWELVTDDLLDWLPPAALTAVRQVAEELTVRESMIFLDGPQFTGEPPGLHVEQRHLARPLTHHCPNRDYGPLAGRPSTLWPSWVLVIASLL